MQVRRLWLDVGDLFWWPHNHVTGIQRTHASVVMELLRGPPPGTRVFFCAVSSDRGFHRVPDLLALDRAAQLLNLPRPAQPPPALPRKRFRPVVKLAKLALRAFPAELRQPTRHFCYAGEALAKAVGRWMTKPLRRRLAKSGAGPVPEPGDVLLNIGCSWINAIYNDTVRREQKRVGLRYVVMLYDCNPYSVPQYHIEEAVTRFCDWAEDTVHVADKVLTISRYSQQDLLRFMQERELPLKTPQVIRLADVLPPDSRTPTRRAELATIFERGNYLLTLSSIAPSKNHGVIVRAMQLLRQRGVELPLFVWAGTNVNTGHVDKLLEDEPEIAARILRTGILDENDLRLAFTHCRLTIFPSLFEGWGLPVAESLVCGKVCLASNATSIPEVGGPLVDYFDPDDETQLADLIERYLDDKAVAAREAEIRRGHRVTTWSQTTRQLLEALPA